MSKDKKQNPYQVLRLDTKASMHEVIARSRELSSETNDERQLMKFRVAAEEIRQHPAKRACHQFWEPPDTKYDCDVIDDFCRRHRRAPITTASFNDRSERFCREDCTVARLIPYLVPRPQVPNDIGSFLLTGVSFEASREKPSVRELLARERL